MTKFVLWLWMVAGILALAPPAAAESVKFSNFSTQVPAGWSHEEEAGITYLFSPGHDCGVMIYFAAAEGESGQEAARVLALALGGSQPQPLDGVRSYAFNANIKGLPATISVSVVLDVVFMFGELGAYDNYETEVFTIYNNLEGASAAIKAMTDTLEKTNKSEKPFH
jgi:hypothetical protein